MRTPTLTTDKNPKGNHVLAIESMKIVPFILILLLVGCDNSGEPSGTKPQGNEVPPKVTPQTNVAQPSPSEELTAEQVFLKNAADGFLSHGRIEPYDWDPSGLPNPTVDVGALVRKTPQEIAISDDDSSLTKVRFKIDVHWKRTKEQVGNTYVLLWRIHKKGDAPSWEVYPQDRDQNTCTVQVLDTPDMWLWYHYAAVTGLVTDKTYSVGDHFKSIPPGEAHGDTVLMKTYF